MSCSPEKSSKVKELIRNSGLTIGGEGAVGGKNIAIEKIASIDTRNAFNAWRSGLEEIFGA